MKIKKDNKTITISKFLKFCTKGVLQFIRNYDDFFVENNKGKIFVHLNNKENYLTNLMIGFLLIQEVFVKKYI